MAWVLWAVRGPETWYGNSWASCFMVQDPSRGRIFENSTTQGPHASEKRKLKLEEKLQVILSSVPRPSRYGLYKPKGPTASCPPFLKTRLTHRRACLERERPGGANPDPKGPRLISSIQVLEFLSWCSSGAAGFTPQPLAESLHWAPSSLTPCAAISQAHHWKGARGSSYWLP